MQLLRHAPSVPDWKWETSLHGGRVTVKNTPGSGVAAAERSVWQKHGRKKTTLTSTIFFSSAERMETAPIPVDARDRVSVARVITRGNCRFDVVATEWPPANKLTFVPGRSPCLDPPSLLLALPHLNAH
jgi:hypothetical protein